jgi:light-regulated signal transduction histidine kinase (bacteriophytochrome)
LRGHLKFSTPSSRRAAERIGRYGLAVAMVTAATALGYVADLLSVENLPFPLFLMSIGATVWFAGMGPGILGLVLSSLCFTYFFTPPLYEFSIARSDRPYFAAFVLFALMVSWFASTRHRIEQELRQARDELEKANATLERQTIELEASNKELEAFAYSTSHDLRAPLRHIAGYAELLQKSALSVLDAKSRRYVTMILESARTMGVLIDDLLAFSRVGRAEAQNTFVDLEELAREVSGQVERDATGRTIVWRIGALPSLRGDRSMLKVVLVNLVSNAAKFTRTRAQASIEIGAAAGKKDEVVIFVKDNGVGFDMKYVDKLFGVFQRLHGIEEFEGTGIGLATVQRIIARHGGKVWAEGVVDEGATFYFSAPRAERGET